MKKNDEFKYFHDVTLLLSSTLDMQKAMLDTFELLSEHFPLEAISLHQVMPGHDALKLLFLVRKGAFHLVRKVVELEPNIRITEPPQQQRTALISIPNNMENPVSRSHALGLADLVAPEPRAYMIGMLQADKGRIGHLCLIGNAVNCFTSEHVQKLRLLLEPFSLAMSNMLRFKEITDFQQRLDKEKRHLEAVLETFHDQRIVGENHGLKKTMTAVRQLRDWEVPVLIRGETGSGKELVANAIQRISPRRDAPFIKINCGAIPETLIDSELFGFEKGAFTGAVSSKPGRFEIANGGTLFLDEVGELPPKAQVRLLRVLQNGTLERVGGTKVISVDVRIIAATNRNLETMLQDGSFREDLYYRLKVFPITVPPLRSRLEDIVPLVIYFMQKIAMVRGMERFPSISDTLRQRLCAYSWPGNVRELENLVEQAMILFAANDPTAPLDMEQLLPQDPGWYLPPIDEQRGPGALRALAPSQRVPALSGAAEESGSRLACVSCEWVQRAGELPPSLPSSTLRGASSLWPALDDTIRSAILLALQKTRWRISGTGGAAALLGLNPSTLRAKMRKLGIVAARSTEDI